VITIYQSRSLGKDDVYCKVSVALRDKLHEFNTGKTFSSLGVFLAIALRTNDSGWSWPSRDRIKGDTGLGNTALSSALAHLRSVRLDGKRILAHYRVREPGSQRWGRSAYLIFPDSAHGPPPFEHLVEFDPKQEKPSGYMLFLAHCEVGYRLEHCQFADMKHRVGALKKEYADLQIMASRETENPIYDVGVWFTRWTPYRLQSAYHDLPDAEVKHFTQWSKTGSWTEEELPARSAYPDVDQPDADQPDVADPDQEEEPSVSRTSLEEETPSGADAPPEESAEEEQPNGFPADGRRAVIMTPEQEEEFMVQTRIRGETKMDELTDAEKAEVGAPGASAEMHVPASTAPPWLSIYSDALKGYSQPYGLVAVDVLEWLQDFREKFQIVPPRKRIGDVRGWLKAAVDCIVPFGNAMEDMGETYDRETVMAHALWGLEVFYARRRHGKAYRFNVTSPNSLKRTMHALAGELAAMQDRFSLASDELPTSEQVEQFYNEQQPPTKAGGFTAAQQAAQALLQKRTEQEQAQAAAVETAGF